MKILHIWKRFDHHSSHSGYDQLTRYLPATHYQPGKLFQYLYTRNPARFRWIRSIDPEWYNFENFSVEMELLCRINLVRNTIFHMLYGENFYRFLGYSPLRRGNRVIPTFHQPPDIFRRAIPKSYRVRRADAVLVVGSSQVDFFRDLTGRDNVYLVPHGIDTDFFSPPAEKRFDGPLRCISVGWWLRDVEMIRKIISVTNQLKAPNIEYHIVTFKWCHEFYQGLKNVHLYTDIHDNQLRDLYRRSHLLLLPLKDCTANNAVLESMACGLPVLSTAAGSNPDYLDDDFAVMTRGDNPDPLIDTILDLDKNRDRLTAMGQAARRKAETFAWPLMAERTLECYRRIL